MKRSVLVGGTMGTVGLALVGLGPGPVLAGLAVTLWLAWWEQRKELAVASGRFVRDRSSFFGVREVGREALAEAADERDSPPLEPGPDIILL